MPKYIPKQVRHLTASDTMSELFVTSDATPSQLYLYNWLISNNARAQSAWNTWRLPAQSNIVWVGISGDSLFALVQRPGTQALLLRQSILPSQTDAEGDYLTAVDFRCKDTDCTFAYDTGTKQTTITLPYRADEAVGVLTNFFVVVRDDEPDGFYRGRPFPIVGATNTTIVVSGDCRAYDLYLGFQIVSERTESEFYLRTDDGHQPLERLQVSDVIFVHARTGYYRAEVTYDDGARKTYTFEGRVFGDPGNLIDKVVTANGQLGVPVMAKNTDYTLRLVNDSFLPSAWESAEYRFQAVDRSKPAQPRRAA